MIEALINFILELVGGTVFLALFYWPGWLLLKVLTLGRYPPPKPGIHNEMLVATLGFAGCLCAIVILLSLRSAA